MIHEHYNIVLNDIRNLHNSTSKCIFNNKKKNFSNCIKLDLLEFKNYFENQWCNNVFCNWAIFHSPSGFTTRNNRVEAYNATIKTFFTNILKSNLLPSLKFLKRLWSLYTTRYF